MKSIEIKIKEEKWNHEVVQQKRITRGEKYLLNYFVVLDVPVLLYLAFHARLFTLHHFVMRKNILRMMKEIPEGD